MALDFMKHFPFPTIRSGQQEVLRTIQKNINNADVFVVRSPVASGKSGIAVAIQNAMVEEGWGCGIVVPNNILRDQYTQEFSHMMTVKGQHEYIVPAFDQFHGRRRIPHSDMSVKEFRRQYGTWPRNNPYSRDLNACKRKGTPTVLNTYAYLAHKLYKDVIIFDESHELLDTLRELHSKTIWQKKAKYPDGLRSFGELIDWASRNLHKPNIELLHKELIKEHPASVIEYTEDYYHGELLPCIKIKPLHVKDKSPILWPDKCKKLILMSATISPKDIEYLGLDDRVVQYIDTPSPIPKEQRKIVPMNVGSMAARHQDENLDRIVESILELASKYEGKSGLVHAPYSLAFKLRNRLKDDPRFMFHTQLNKNEQLEKFKKETGKILVGSGMYAGIDLKYELASFQVICKVPFGNLGDSKNRWLSKNDPDYYTWETAKNLLQASGRVCRAEDDIGHTYVLDSCFDMWYRKCEHLLPQWFKEGVVK